MITVKSVISTLIFAVILTEVTSWTIDLPEVRKYYFERNAYKHGDENKIYFSDRPELVKYNNIEGNSFHNTPHLHEGVNGGEFDGNSHYADHYGYHTYMEKKVHSIVHKGAIYLDGLRRAMEVYSERLNNCSQLERHPLHDCVSIGLPVPESLLRHIQWNGEQLIQSSPPTNRTWIPESDSEQRPLNASELAMVSCEKATRESEHVRRLSSLVVWAIRELQDISYAKDYDKNTKESEENVLLLQLAWALDELARLTGYEPDAAQFTTSSTPAPMPTTTRMTYFKLPIPNDGPTMSNCIKDKSSDPTVPATVRCAVPVPAVVLNFLNMTNSATGDVNSTSQAQDIMRLLTMFNNSGSGQGQQTFNNMTSEEVRQQMLGCLTNSASDPSTCSGFQSFMQFLNNNFPQQSPQNNQPRPNRETDSSQLEILEAAEDHSVMPLRKQRKLRQKRSTNDPLKELANYYVKYKAWTNTNPLTQDGAVKLDSYDVKNELTPVKTIRKRSVNFKDGIIVRIPEDPMQDLSNYIKHKSGVNYVRNAAEGDKIRAYLEKMRSNGLTAKEHVRKLEKMIKSVHKRSVHYRKLHKPHQPEDPMQDISYYVKNKPGTNIRPNLAHAGMVRAGLQAIFERGNIIVIRRYGSNYIPGVQPLMVGQVESFTL